jgi:cytochrome c2
MGCSTASRRRTDGAGGSGLRLRRSRCPGSESSRNAAPATPRNRGGRNGVGPNLWGIYGSPAGKREGFRYSANMRELADAGLVWNEENLRKYLTNPKDLVPRGSMAFAGIRNPEQLNNLIAYLRTLQ